jgi:hypothetical protein
MDVNLLSGATDWKVSSPYDLAGWMAGQSLFWPGDRRIILSSMKGARRRAFRIIHTRNTRIPFGNRIG